MDGENGDRKGEKQLIPVLVKVVDGVLRFMRCFAEVLVFTTVKDAIR
jgi:hypothetical protein